MQGQNGESLRVNGRMVTDLLKLITACNEMRMFGKLSHIVYNLFLPFY